MEAAYFKRQLAINRDRIAALARGISEEQASWKPDPESWSILEDHMIYSTQYVTKDYPVYAAEGIEIYGSGNYSAIGWSRSRRARHRG